MAVTRYSDRLPDQTDSTISEAELRGRQSVRTTFRLPMHLIELLGIIASQFGVKQKSLFDQLIENREVLIDVARRAADYTPEKIDRRAKTFVLSKQALNALERVAGEWQISRDMLVEGSIRRLLPLLLAEREKHYKRTRILGEMERYLRRGRKLLGQAEDLVGQSDPVYEMIERMVSVGEDKLANLAEIVAKGKTIENVSLERFSGDMVNGEGV